MILLFTWLFTLVLALPALAQTSLQPNQRMITPRPDAPPPGRYDFEADLQEFTGTTRHLQGHAKIETDTMLVQADEIQYNEETHDLRGTGHIYFHNFARNEQLWADRVVYNTESETGTFYNVRGSAAARIDARPGMLTTNEPFFFQGEWAERQEDRYILHNGFVTNCKMPNPWWTLRGPKFDIKPGERAIAYHSTFWVRKMPLFFTPYFYKSLEKVPRRSGFLMPEFGNSTYRGLMFGVGYFWAINRSYDLTYRLIEYTSRGDTHHFDFRGKPRPGTDFDAIIYGVNDRGISIGGGSPQTYSGASVNIAGKSALGNGWYARGEINYITSFRFRQNWSESFNEAIGSEVHSVGFLNKNWSDYSFNIAGSRLENFQTPEIAVVNPATQAVTYETNAVTIRKVPEANFSGREHQILKHVPVWFSFDSAAGLLHREEPLYLFNNLVEDFETGQFTRRVNIAPRLMSAFHWGAFNVVPGFGIQETWYSQSQGPAPAASRILNQPVYSVLDTALMRSSRDFSVDFFLPPLARVFQKKTRFGDKLKHVIEPRATYHYVTGIGENFDRFIRFDETDLLSNTNELDLSLTNRIYAKRGNAVNEIFTWELWQARYFDPSFGGALLPGQRNVFLTTAELTPYSFLTGPRSSSPVVSVLSMNPIPFMGIEWRADYDHRRGDITNSTVSFDYHWKAKYFVTVGHNFVHTDPILNLRANQFRFRAGVGGNTRRGWNAGVDGIYDYFTRTLQYATTQLTYNTDCCGLSLQWRLFPRVDQQGIHYESQFRLSFSVANLGSFGTLRRQDRIF